MTATTSIPGDYRPRAARGVGDRDYMELQDRQAFLSRWLTVWVALVAVVILVVVAYLIVIGNSLASINSGLAVAQRAVTGAGGHTKTLPSQISGINSSLAGINQALKPIPGQGNAIVSNLTSIEGSLTSIDTSLKSTSPMLVGVASTLGGVTSNLNGISSSLVDTSGVLQHVLRTANSINGTLVAANQPSGDCTAPETNGVYNPPAGVTVGSYSCGAGQLGVQNIHQRVAIADNILAPAQNDLVNITGGLVSVNGHLISVCKSGAITALNSLKGGASC